jgi:ADP-ribosylglycohydrolase
MLNILLSKPPLTYLTMHRVATWVELYTTLETKKDTLLQPPLEKLPLQYIWTDDSIMMLLLKN